MTKPRPPIVVLSPAQRDIATEALRRKLDEAHALAIGSFEARDLIDWFADELGVLFYNQAIADVEKTLQARLETVADAVRALEK